MSKNKQVGYADRVNIVKKVKTQTGWCFAPLVKTTTGRVRWDHVLVQGKEEIHPEGTYYLDWYRDGRRLREAAGKIVSDVLDKARRKALVVEGYSQGISIPEPDASPLLLQNACSRFLTEIKNHKKRRTYLNYRWRLTLFLQSCTKRYINQVTREDLLDFFRYHLELGMEPQTASNAGTTVVQLLRENGIQGLLKKDDWPKFMKSTREVYKKSELTTFFNACTDEERVLFRFFLLTGFREQEVMYTSWRDVNFEDQLIAVTDKPDVGFFPKTWEEREVPIPVTLLSELRERRKHQHGRWVFGTSGNKPRRHMIEICRQWRYVRV